MNRFNVQTNRSPHFFVLLLVLAFTFSWNALAAISELTGIAYGKAVLAQVNQMVNFGRVVTLEQLTGGSYSKFEVPNRLHMRGYMHAAMYRYTREGSSRLVKVILPSSTNLVADALFQQEAFGMLLSSHVGGPKIYSAGRIQTPDGQKGFYIEMEEIFFGAVNSFTFKGIGSRTFVVGTGNKPLIIPLTFSFPSDTQLQKIAKLIRLNIERGISIGNDPDLIFYGQDVRWIDGAEWSLTLEKVGLELADLSRLNYQAELALDSYGHLLTLFLQIRPRAGRFLVHALKEEIAASSVWNEAQKAGILSNLRTVLVGTWKWSEANYESDGQQSLSESLFKRCMQMLMR